jgi:hypothetical protein
MITSDGMTVLFNLFSASLSFYYTFLDVGCYSSVPTGPLLSGQHPILQSVCTSLTDSVGFVLSVRSPDHSGICGLCIRPGSISGGICGLCIRPGSISGKKSCMGQWFG